MTTTVRVDEQTRDRVAALARATGRRMQQVIEDAIEAYERELFFAQLAEGYDRLAGDERAWAEVEAERAGEGPTLRDDVGDDQKGHDEPPSVD